MALTDIVFKASSAVASRGNVGTVVDYAIGKNNTGVVSPTYYGGYWTVSGTFKTSADVNLPNGTVINAYHATTHLKVGSGTTTNGTATFSVTTSANVYLVADPSGLSGETICTTAFAPS